MARNPYFRVLALSATPGNDPEKVQTVIDNLHINHIEIRTDDAIDIRRYVHGKSEQYEFAQKDIIIEGLKTKWGELMDKHYLNHLRKFQLLRGDQTADNIRPFTLQTLSKDPSVRGKNHICVWIAKARMMAAAMTFLLDSSAKLFKDRVLEFCQEGGAIKQASVEVQEILTEVDQLRVTENFYRHPKMDVLREVLSVHFSEDEIAAMQDEFRAEDTGGEASHRRTRAMVFCSSREVVDEIVANLKAIGMAADRFVGQQGDRNNKAGMGQKEQKQTIQDFKDGKIRVLVSTAVGEEGLDIGEIDLIVCYEATADPIRMLQRVGRTGRKRSGKIVLIVTAGRDDKKYKQAKEKHAMVLKSITESGNYELYDDVERMVPDDIRPVVVKKAVPQPDFQLHMIAGRNNSTGRAAASTKKSKAKG